jgi:eukaryotic-like serine/threonine-protein kinase
MIRPGTILGGRYRLDEHISSGGMGEVWRGHDTGDNRPVAVKVLHPSFHSESGFVARFRTEAQAMSTIHHAGVVQIYDFGQDGAVGTYLVMQFVDGEALSRTLVRVKRLTAARTMALVAQAGDALAAVHRVGVVHRDVKPGNLLVRRDGSLVLSDFGIARIADAPQLTAPGSVVGTAAYLAPEVAMGERASELSDVYSLGVVAYQCLAGRRPFDGGSPMEVATRQVREPPPPLPRDVPPAAKAVVDVALAKRPAARFRSAAAFAEEARRVALELGATGPVRAG